MKNKIGSILMMASRQLYFDIVPKAHKLRSFIYKRALKQKYCFSVHHNVRIFPHHTTLCDFRKINDNGLSVGKNCLFNDDVILDLTGNVVIGDNVSFAESVVVYTHVHIDLIGCKTSIKPNTLTIEDGVSVGARSIILNTCKKIGRYSQIGAGSVVRSSIPPYSVVMGNPSKVVGFVFTPEEIIEHEKKLYPEEERLPINLLEKNYEKYFLSKNKEIKKFTSLTF